MAPKLRISLPFNSIDFDYCDLEHARLRFNWGHEDFLVTVDDQVLNSYEEFNKLVTRECYRDQEYIEVRLVPLVGGG